jgi:hypothetical protein
MTITNVEQATEFKFLWKHDTTRAFARVVLELALRKFDIGVTTFYLDEIPEEDQALDGTTSGCVVKLLRTAHVIEPTSTFRASLRKCCHGHICVGYRLVNRGIGAAALKSCGGESKRIQDEMVLK